MGRLGKVLKQLTLVWVGLFVLYFLVAFLVFPHLTVIKKMMLSSICTSIFMAVTFILNKTGGEVF